MQSEIITVVRELLNAMGASYTDVVASDVAGQTIITINAEDGKQLIGSHGDTVHAIDLIVKKIIQERREKADADASEEPHFLIDVNDYRARQIRDLQTKALMMAERARSFQYDVELTPMSAYERLIVHTTLQDAPHVKTESQGEGRSRRVVIRYTSEG